VHVPTRAGAHGLSKAAELLLRSGGFGMVVIDESETRANHHCLDNATASRLFALAREHRSSVLLLTAMRDHAVASSASPLVGLRIEPHRTRIRPGRFAVEPRIRKDKSGLLVPLAPDVHRAPDGLR
jgi:recombination protein RecA